MPTKPTPQQAITSLNIASGLTNANITQLADISVVQEFAKDAIVFREGQMHSQIYWVHSGRVRLEMTLPSRLPTALLTVGPGEVLAWSAFLGTQKMTASGIAATDTILLGFEVGPLKSLCESNHEIGYRFTLRLCEGLSQRLVATRLQLLDLFCLPHEGSA